jgi:prophage tail gpP-like protein
MRNIYLTDDANGNIVGMRASGSGGSGAQLTEGGNIKSAIAVLSTRDALEQYDVQGQNFSTDQRWGRQASAVSATGGYSGEPGTYKNTTMPMPGDSTDAAMYCQRVIGEDAARSVEVTVVVRGWFADGGNLWIAMIGQQVTVNSPLLFPNDKTMSLYIRGVTHKQNDATGTETEIVLCNIFGLGGDAPAGTDETMPGGTPTPATPDAPDAPDPAASPGEF